MNKDMKKSKNENALENVCDKKSLKMRSQGKKPYSLIRSLERQRKNGIKPEFRKNQKTYL
jgi:hypothetical protein